MTILKSPKQGLVSFFKKSWSGLNLRRSSSRWWERWLTAVLSVVPLIMVWHNPFFLSYAVIIILAVWLLVLWQQWSAWDRLVSWLIAGLVLLVYWGSTLLMWLFLENYWYRIMIIMLTLFVTWWYLKEWQRLRLKIFLGEAGAGSTPTLILSFISCFALGSTADSFLVYLNTPLWQLLLAFYLPIAVLLVFLVYASGWSPVKKWSYWFTGFIILLQLFILSIWWPTSFYVIGFTLASAFTLITLVMRQEAQGFINRRSFIRELSLVMMVLLLVLISARWY